ncbi:MAG TPA: Uma2 family endonuclease [Thermoanaerobaculia bacterium]|jgi:Uma2 family endonuclease|nr:Uma2 family endonuclease [Thermoanaerobaculia bacterium]
MGEPARPLTFPWHDDDQAWPAQGQWTYADYLRLPDDGCRYEVIRGHLYVTPAPAYDHQRVVTRFAWVLTQFEIETGLGEVLVAPFDILLPDGISSPVEPDLIFFRSGNQPRAGDPNFQGVPDLVIEVESPKTRKRDRTVKQSAYREAGVPEYWRASPRLRTVTVLALSEDRSRYVELGCFGRGETVRSALLPGLAILVDSLFPLG